MNTSFLRDLLKALEEKFPPVVGCHHNITYADDGSDATGHSNV